MPRGNFTIFPSHEARLSYGNDYALCLHYGRFNYGNGTSEEGYRFTWDTPQGFLTFGQARIPSFCEIHELMAEAIKQGWGKHVNTINNLGNVWKQPTKVLHEVRFDRGDPYFLCLQYCRFDYGSGIVEEGYRFTWDRPNGYLKGVQTRIPSYSDIDKLMAQAIVQGWGHYIND